MAFGRLHVLPTVGCRKHANVKDFNLAASILNKAMISIGKRLGSE